MAIRPTSGIIYAAFDRLSTAEEAVAVLLSGSIRPSELSVATAGIYVSRDGADPDAAPEYVGSGAGALQEDVERIELTQVEESDAPEEGQQQDSSIPRFEPDAAIHPSNYLEESVLLGGDQGLTTMAVQGFGVLVGDGPMALKIAPAGFWKERTQSLQQLVRQYLVDQRLEPAHAAFFAGYVRRGALLEVAMSDHSIPIAEIEQDLREHGAARTAIV